MTLFLALSLGLVVGLVIGVFAGVVAYAYFSPDRKQITDDILKAVQPIGRVSESGGGYVSVFVDRDLANYPEPGRRVFVGGKS